MMVQQPDTREIKKRNLTATVKTLSHVKTKQMLMLCGTNTHETSTSFSFLHTMRREKPSDPLCSCETTYHDILPIPLYDETFSHTTETSSIFIVHVVPSEVISSSLEASVSLPSDRTKINLGFKQTNEERKENEVKVEAKPLEINHWISRFLFVLLQTFGELNHVERKSEVDFCVCILAPFSVPKRIRERNNSRERATHAPCVPETMETFISI